MRLKITIHLNGNHALSIDQMNALKRPIERGIAAALPDCLAVDTIKVTKVAEMKSARALGPVANRRRVYASCAHRSQTQQ